MKLVDKPRQLAVPFASTGEKTRSQTAQRKTRKRRETLRMIPDFHR